MTDTYAVIATAPITIELPGMPAETYAADEVTNVIRCASDYQPGAGLRLQIVPAGWSVVDRKLVQTPVSSEPSGPPPVPTSVTRRQLLLGLTEAGLISTDEALAAAKSGAVPAAMEAVFAALPGPTAFAARITWASMAQAERADPLVAALGASKSMDDAALDDFFRLCATL